MKRLRTPWAPAVALAISGCIVPVYGTGAATNVYCPPNGVCPDGGTSGATATGSSGGTGTASGGTTGPGSSTGASSGSSGGSSGGGCNPHDDGGTELKPCAHTDDCDCPERCLPLGDAGAYCQTPCATFDDCNSLELCNAGYCAYDVCTGEFSACTAGNGDAGWCIDVAAPSGSSLGLCFPSGTSDGGCDPSTTTGPWKGWTPAGACVGSYLCAALSPGDPNGTCLFDCVPGDGSCIQGSSCIPLGSDSQAGVCVPCPANQTSCGATCFDPLTDDLHCGGGSGVDSCSEGMVCPPGRICLGGSCTRPAPLTSPRYGLAAATGPDGLIYIVGGFSAGVPLASTESFDPRTNQWTQLAPLPLARGELGAAWGSDGNFHAITGLRQSGSILTATDRNDMYDPLGASWLASDAPLLDFRFGVAMSSDANGAIYVAGGGNGLFSPTNTVYRSDAAADGGWDVLAPLSSVREFAGSAFGSDGRLYVLGGLDDIGPVNKVEAYDAGSGVWDETVPGLPAPLAFLGAVTLGDTLFAIGGGVGTDGGFTTQTNDNVYALDTAACSAGSCAWAPSASLWTARGAHATVLGPDGRLYAFGGLVSYSNATAAGFIGLPSVEVYDPNQPDGGWVSSICPNGRMFDLPDAGFPAGSGTGTELAAGNLSSDGFPDAVTLSGGSFVPLINDKSGDLVLGTPLTADAGVDGLRGLTLADINQDGRLDAVAVSPDENTLYLAEGDGNGGFATLSPYATSDGGSTSGPRATAVADFNGDGWPDVAVADTGGSSVSILLGTNFLGGFTGFSLSSFPTCASPTQILAADLNADGKPDLVVLCAPGSGGSVQVWINGGSGTTFSLAPPLTVTAPTSLAVADLNLDGLPDIAAAASEGASSIVTPFLNQGGATPTFLAGPGGAVASNTDPWSLVVADINGDGYPDFLAIDAFAQTVYLFINQLGTTGGLLAVGNYPTASSDTPIWATATDLRQNGWNDLLVLNQTGNSVSVFLSSCPP